MSFLKINDPAKRDFLVEEFLKSKRNIKNNFRLERMDDIGLQRDLTKFYKPLIDTQSGISTALSAIKDSTADTSTALKALPTTLSSSLKAIKFPQYPSIEVFESQGDDSIQDISTLDLGGLATKYLQQYTSNKKSTDTTFGIYSKEGVFYIGDTPITIEGDDITVGSNVYTGTPSLWDLITLSKPNKSIYDSSDLSYYADILDETNAMRQRDYPSRPKSSRSWKYKEIIKPIWELKVKGRSEEERASASVAPMGVASTKRQIQDTSLEDRPSKESRSSETSGDYDTVEEDTSDYDTVFAKSKKTGRGTVIILPHDPNALTEMLSLRMSSFKAGNTGVRNEIIAICDELLRQEVINRKEYKNIMLHI